MSRIYCTVSALQLSYQTFQRIVLPAASLLQYFYFCDEGQEAVKYLYVSTTQLDIMSRTQQTSVQYQPLDSLRGGKEGKFS